MRARYRWWIGGLQSFCAFRFLLGAGEAANWPGATKAVAGRGL